MPTLLVPLYWPHSSLFFRKPFQLCEILSPSWFVVCIADLITIPSSCMRLSWRGWSSAQCISGESGGQSRSRCCRKWRVALPHWLRSRHSPMPPCAHQGPASDTRRMANCPTNIPPLLPSGSKHHTHQAALPLQHRSSTDSCSMHSFTLVGTVDWQQIHAGDAELINGLQA